MISMSLMYLSFSSVYSGMHEGDSSDEQQANANLSFDNGGKGLVYVSKCYIIFWEYFFCVGELMQKPNYQYF